MIGQVQVFPLEQGRPTQKNRELLLAAHEPPFMIYFAARSARKKGNQIKRIKERKKVKKLPGGCFFFFPKNRKFFL